VRNGCLAVYQYHLISYISYLAEQLAINELIGNDHKAVALACEHLVLKLVSTEKVFCDNSNSLKITA
jgi:hypothetical protein